MTFYLIDFSCNCSLYAMQLILAATADITHQFSRQGKTSGPSNLAITASNPFSLPSHNTLVQQTKFPYFLPSRRGRGTSSKWSNVMFLGSPWVFAPNRTSICSAVFTGRRCTTDIPTDRQTHPATGTSASIVRISCNRCSLIQYFLTLEIFGHD